MRTLKSSSLLLFAALLAGSVMAAPPTARDGYFVDSNGAALYTFDKDTGGKSACVDNCAKNWPPALAAEDDTADGIGGVWHLAKP